MMKRIRCGLLFFSCLFLFVSCARTSPFYRYQLPIRKLKEPPYLKVLLTAHRNVSEATISLTGSYKIVPYVPDRQAHFVSSRVLMTSARKPVHVRAQGGKLKIGKIDLDESDVVLIPLEASRSLVNPKTPLTGQVQVGKRSYRGYLRIKVIPNDKLLLGNIIDLESYLYGVIGSEMDLRYPEPALSVQAIASRTLAMFRIKRRRIKQELSDTKPSPEDDFDLTDDVFSQVYRGEERVTKKAVRVVNDTRGIILAYQGKIFEALFHDTCGGHTEPAHLIWGGISIAPLGGRKCGFCAHSRFNQWKASFSEWEIVEKLKLRSKGIEGIESIRKAPGGHITLVGLKTPIRLVEMNAQRFRIALDPNRLRSTLFRVKKTGNTFVFTGQGWGHGVGMCQEGACGMARQAFNTLEMLEYYYPDARVVKIY